jgi:SAM-dependent methyltransferase
MIVREGALRVIISSLAVRNATQKITIEPLEDEWKVVFYEKVKNYTRVVDKQSLSTLLEGELPRFKQVDLFFPTRHCHVTMGQGSPWKFSWNEQMSKELTRTHNRQKAYAFPEHEATPFLELLGVMDSHGNVRSSMRKKFVQINAFLDVVEDLFVPFKGKKIRVVDAGCGKGYLSFAMSFFLPRIGVDAEVVGVDSRNDVMETCTRIQEKLFIKNLRFECGTIGSISSGLAPDVLIALHACNTATDVALFKAVQHQSKAFAVAPCCQHELSSLIPKDLFPMISKQPCFLQKAAALMTDAMRCELLSSCGYKVKAVEFVDPDHTPKNTLLKGQYTGCKKQLGKDFQSIRSMLPSGILLERLLVEHGMLC